MERDKNTPFQPRVLLAGSKRDLLGLTKPVHMCSNCWNNSVEPKSPPRGTGVIVSKN